MKQYVLVFCAMFAFFAMQAQTLDAIDTDSLREEVQRKVDGAFEAQVAQSDTLFKTVLLMHAVEFSNVKPGEQPLLFDSVMLADQREKLGGIYAQLSASPSAERSDYWEQKKFDFAEYLMVVDSMGTNMGVFDFKLDTVACVAQYERLSFYEIVLDLMGESSVQQAQGGVKDLFFSLEMLEDLVTKFYALQDAFKVDCAGTTSGSGTLGLFLPVQTESIRWYLENTEPVKPMEFELDTLNTLEQHR